MLIATFAAALAMPALPNVSIASVTWHGDVAEAKRLAKARGKPLLVLHMMGRLNDEFC